MDTNTPDTANNADQVYNTPATVDDRAEPAPRAATHEADNSGLQPDDLAAVKEPRFHGEDARAEFYSRQRKQTRAFVPAETDEVGGLIAQAEAPFATPEGELPAEPPAPREPPPAPQAPQQTQQPSYRLKVYGNEFDVNRAKLLELASMTEDEAAGLPDTTLIRAAQILEAARLERQQQPKTVSPSVDQGGQAGKPPANGADPTATNPAGSEAGGDLTALSDDDLMDKVQFGEKEEARLALREINRRDTLALSNEASHREVRDTFARDLQDFVTSNQDLAANRAASAFTITTAMEEAKDLLIASGRYDPREVAPLTDHQRVLDLYTNAFQSGAVSKPLKPIMEAAAVQARRAYGIGTPSPQPQPGTSQPSQMSASEQRTMAKRGLAQPPSRAGTIEPPAPPPTRESSRLAAINEMRKARGQSPLPS